VTIPEIPWWKVTLAGGFAYTPFSFEGWIGGGTNGWQIGTAPNSGRPGNAEFSAPSGIFVDAAGYIYVSDNNNNRIQKWDLAGNHIGWIGGGVNGWQAGSSPSAGTGNGQFNGTSKVVVDSNGNIYATDPGNNRIQKWDASGNMLGWIGGGINGWQTGTASLPGNGNCQFDQPMGVALDSAGNIYVSDKENHRVQKWDTNGVCIGWIGGGVNGWQTGTAPTSGSANGMFFFPMDVAIDSNGNTYVADTGNWRIQKWDPAGNVIGWIGGGGNGWKTSTAPATGSIAFGAFQEVFGVSVDGIGNIYVANSGAHSVYKWTASGNVVGWIGNAQYSWQTGDVTGTFGSALGYFEFPWDAAVGPDGKLYIADTYNARVQKWKE
jgi:sugar lactone lactonase YvrE